MFYRPDAYYVAKAAADEDARAAEAVNQGILRIREDRQRKSRIWSETVSFEDDRAAQEIDALLAQLEAMDQFDRLADAIEGGGRFLW